MKYRHQYHAGNFADVHKHVLLLEVLRALTRKDKGLLFVDTHAGRGDYDLHPASPAHPALIRYRDLVSPGARGGSLHYPGSPMLAARTLRAVDRAVFFETQRDEASNLRKVLPGELRARVDVADGFQGLRALLPPPERRACVLIDPPYEDRADLSHVIAAVKDSLQRLENAVLLLWLPVKQRGDFDSWLAMLHAATARPVLASLLWMHPLDSRAALNGSALVLVNPPYLVEEEMREWLPELQALLGGPQSGCEVLATGEHR